MKKIMILAAAAAMFMFSSCQKEEVTPGQNSQSEELVFTATIDQNSSKTTINTTDGKIEWVEGDEITITDAKSTSVIYVAESSGASVSFKKKEGETGSLASGSTYSATYKEAPATAQAYTDYYSAANTAKDLYMTASSTTGTTLTFKAACGLLKLNLTAASGDNAKDISKIEIVGTPTGGSAAVYTLTCDNESIESAKDFYIALPAGSYTLMKFTNSKGSVCFKKATNAMEIAANAIQPVTLSGITFSALLPGKFIVASGKQVQFTTANLYWDSSAFKLEASQTGYPTSWNTSHVGHFYWTKTATNSYAASYNELASAATTDKFFADGSDTNHMLTIDGQSGLYALSSAEWTYLLSSTSDGGRGDGDSKFKFPVTVNGVTSCLVIAPDGYIGSIASSYDAAAWATAEASGLVCLPAAGLRMYGPYLASGGSNGYYWSATPYEINKSSAYHLRFDGSGVYPSYSDNRNDGYSVRLVYSAVLDAPVYPETPTLACVMIGDVWWAPVNCGYDATNYPYGKLYQWGRHDGCGYNTTWTNLKSETVAAETIIQSTTQGPISADKENASEFYKNGASPNDWLSTRNNYRWNSATGDNDPGKTTQVTPIKTDNDPCPSGWRVPTYYELNALINTKMDTAFSTGDGTISGYCFGAETNKIFLPAAGYRYYLDGYAYDRGSRGFYLSSSVNGDYGLYLYFYSGTASMLDDRRANGFSIRCVKE